MSKKLSSPIVRCSIINESTLYQVKDKAVYIISNKKTRKLLCEPEIIGYRIPVLLKTPITDLLLWLRNNGKIDTVNIFNILRGGLNFPIEEACYATNIDVKGVSFITSERFFLDKKVSRIETRYRKINPVNNSTIIIGDIIASGETLRNAINYIEETYVVAGANLKRIIIITIGTNNILHLVKEFEKQLKKRWSGFESIIMCFVEGIFNTYTSTGIAKINLPRVDFYINGAVISPEYRKAIISNQTSIFEKCAIYDGGARRFEQLIHINQIITYWKQLKEKSSEIDTKEFLEEKFGYITDISYDDWKGINNYSELTGKELYELFNFEVSFRKMLEKTQLSIIAHDRYDYLNELFSDWYR